MNTPLTDAEREVVNTEYLYGKITLLQAEIESNRAWVESCTKGMIDAQYERNQTLKHMDYLLGLLTAAMEVVNAARAWAHGNDALQEDALHDAVRKWEAK